MVSNFYRPDLKRPEVFFLIKKIGTDTQQGMVSVKYEDTNTALKDKSHRLLGSFRTFQGTETVYEGTRVYEDTGVINCTYSSQVHIHDRVFVPKTGKVYDIVTEPEDITLKHKFLVFKVKRVNGNV